MSNDVIRRGFFRIWAVLTGLLIIFVILCNYGDVAREFQAAAGDGMSVFPPHPWWFLGGLTAFTLGVPLFILILGSGAFWIIDAFAPKQQTRCDADGSR